jgi:hypothetical protein
VARPSTVTKGKGRGTREKIGVVAGAAKTYEHDPLASHLRAMNMLYEGLKSNSPIVLVSSAGPDMVGAADRRGGLQPSP